MFLDWGKGFSFEGFWLVGKWLLYRILAVLCCNSVTLSVCEKGRSFLVFFFFFLFCLWAGKLWIFSGLFRLYFWRSKGIGVIAAIEAGCLQFWVGEKEGFFWVFWVMQGRFLGVSLRSSCDGVSWCFLMLMFFFSGYFGGYFRGFRWMLDSESP